MSVLVFSCGRTGTNMLLEILRGAPELQATPFVEDKQVFHRAELPSNYLSKCDTVYLPQLEMADRLLTLNPDLKVLWTIRDLRDTALSKIYRGQPNGDSPNLSDDATYEGCLEDIEWMHKVYTFLQERHPTQLLVVKMEDIILKFDETIQGVCTFCEIEYREEMKNFTHRYRNSHKATRYKTLDPSQVALHERVDTVYEGFFTTHDIDLESLFANLEKYQKEFGYQ